MMPHPVSPSLSSGSFWIGVLALAAAWDLRPGTTMHPESQLLAQEPPPLTAKWRYPATRRSDHTDDYHGTIVADPYRWLEDPDSGETRSWVAAQNQLTFQHLASLPQRVWFLRRLKELWDYERFDVPQRRGDRYFYTHNNGLANQSVLYCVDAGGGQPRVLVDPNQLSQEGTVALTGWEPSDDGRYVAYGLASAGSDWNEWHVVDVVSGRTLDDHLRWVKFSDASWTPDGRGFYYSRYDQPAPGTELTAANYYQKLCYHRLGDPQERDQLVYQRADEKQWGFDGQVTEDGRYLVIQVSRGTEQKHQIFFQDLRQPAGAVVELIRGFDAEYQFIGNEGSVFWLLTDAEAPLRRIVAVDVAAAAPLSTMRDVVKETTDVMVEAVTIGDRFFVSYLHDAYSQVKLYSLTGQSRGQLPLPGLATVSAFSGRRQDKEAFFALASFTTPSTVYRYDLRAERVSVFREPRVAFAAADFETRQVFVTSRDGTRVPLFITHRKGLQPEGDLPTILYGYGGFNIPLSPNFSVSYLAWMEAGGVYAVANLRGGGEYGRTWHESGMRDKKQNVFDDFLAAAQWLIDHQYCSPHTLAIRGGSNGGLLVGAAMTQRPDLFAAAVPSVGVMDMLRFHKFTIGWAWVSEFGSADDPHDFTILQAYSPLHHLSPQRYPATLILTGDHDDRVVPAHSYKFAAQLQQVQQADEPTLIRIETSAGHGAGTPVSKRIEAEADALAFIAQHVRMTPTPPSDPKPPTDP